MCSVLAAPETKQSMSVKGPDGLRDVHQVCRGLCEAHFVLRAPICGLDTTVWTAYELGFSEHHCNAFVHPTRCMFF